MSEIDPLYRPWPGRSCSRDFRGFLVRQARHLGLGYRGEFAVAILAPAGRPRVHPCRRMSKSSRGSLSRVSRSWAPRLLTGPAPTTRPASMAVVSPRWGIRSATPPWT